jgi:hypothetical protein
MKIFSATASVLLAATVFMGNGYATEILTNPSEPSLQALLDSNTQDGAFMDVTDENNQVSGDDVWRLDATGSASAVLMFEITAHVNTSIFGIYDLGNSSNRLTLFDGAASQGSRIGLSLLGDGLTLRAYDLDTLSILGTSIFSSIDTFGFYLDTVNGTYFSESSLNGLFNGEGADHLVAFQGDGSELMDPDQNGVYSPFSAGEYILAWEDWNLNYSDRDYNDMVVMVESISSVPEPSSIALLGIGLLGMGFSRFRKN